MGQSYRIRTELGVNKTINVQLDQDFEFLEILSLAIQQTDIYIRACADYGVVVGRVTANNGLGVPNARVSVFIPIQLIDESNPIISSIYPYKSPEDKNEDGYRYNLLPYEPSHSGHSPTGTLPTRNDALTGSTVVEIYDKYYKFTSKTNDSGDYMIMGVPVGNQQFVMDLDLSDIGEFSLTPQDLIRIGRATEAQVAGNRFRTSTDLNSLPQIVNLTKTIEVSPLWGDENICQIAINRLDFDLRDDANIDIQPTAVFMGSVYSTPDRFRLRPDFKLGSITIRGGKPRDNFGNLCTLQSGPGQILAIRQTINTDLSGNPILEEYRLEQDGNVIDQDGVWLVELPMNLNYLTTNEFGEKIISNDPTIGIPTKSKYRFKIKWQQSNDFSQNVRRPYYLVPNVREFGWSNTSSDPNTSGSQQQKNQLQSSYYFGLDWSGYTNGFSSTQAITKLNEIIDCQDTFFEFDYNRVYTVSGLIDQYKDGGRGRFIGIKEIDDDSCADSVNKFPVNEGFRNFDFLFFIVSLLLQLFQIISIPLIIAIHFIVFFLNLLLGLRNFLTGLFAVLSGYHLYLAGKYIANGITLLGQSAKNIAAGANLVGTGVAAIAGAALKAIGFSQKKQAVAAFKLAGKEFLISFKYIAGIFAINKLYQVFRGQKIRGISLPVLTYPDCQGCDCKSNELSGDESLASQQSSLLSRFSDPFQYYDAITTSPVVTGFEEDSQQIVALAFSYAVGGNDGDEFSRTTYKTMESDEDITIFKEECPVEFYAYSNYLPLGERVNIFNTRKKYFDGVNRIKVTFDSPNNLVNHLDNTLTVFTTEKLESGTLLSFVNPSDSTDLNYIFTGNTPNNLGIVGQALNPGPSQYNVQYCNPTNPYSNLTTTYQLNTGSTSTGYTFPADIEYYQVLTAITITEAISLFGGAPNESLPQIVNSGTVIRYNNQKYSKVLGTCFVSGWGNVVQTSEIPYSTIFQDYGNQYITILQRGVDPYSPKYINKYGLGILFGYSDADSLIMTAETRLNIPIQKLNSTNISVQPITQNGQSEIYYPSHFFRGGVPNSTIIGQQWSAFTSFNISYYSSLDSTTNPSGTIDQNASPVLGAVVSTPFNGAYKTTPTTPSERVGKYNSAEDLSGGAFYYVDDGFKPSNTSVTYYTNVFLPFFTGNPMNFTTNTLNVMRTDRLPSSDNLDGGSWKLNPALLQQNLGFSIYQITSLDEGGIAVDGYSTGADIPTAQIEGQYAYTNAIETLNVCSQIVGLKCYKGNGTTFEVDVNCADTDAVINGCYQFIQKPLLTIGKDIRNFNEWAYRFRFNYGLCRGVLSQSFTNNWINGSLFMFPVQIDVFYDSNNKPLPPNYPSRLAYFDSDTNNFYYRSSPYLSGSTSSRFIGLPANTTAPQFSINSRNLLFPTTIMNLGMKDSFYDEIIYEPSTKAYVIPALNPTSYSDTSDIVNLFVLSRITNATFLQQMVGLGDNSIGSLFTRISGSGIIQPKNRVDADLVQMMSINSEVGVVPFSTEFYPFDSSNPDNAVVVLQSAGKNVIGIFFSSNTENLQTKDYISPGVINFRPATNANAITYPYGIKTQKVPLYQWGLRGGGNIFGTEKNDWKTSLNDGIVSYGFQSLDRRIASSPSYFSGSYNNISDIYQRGYIFAVDQNQKYSATSGTWTPNFIVGAPYQFYFGITVGASALDKFKSKYSVNE
jgi:hypothetical protein